MRRKDGLAVVGGLWALLAAWAALFIWPIWAGIGWLVGLTALLIYAALFVWLDSGEGK